MCEGKQENYATWKYDGNSSQLIRNVHWNFMLGIALYIYTRCWTTWVRTSGRFGRILDAKSGGGLGRAVLPGELNETDMFNDVLALSLLLGS